MQHSANGLLDTLAGLPVPDSEGLERSCRPADAIRAGIDTHGIERIEARFSGNGFAPHRHDTYALGLTVSGVQTFSYRGQSRFSLPGNIIVLHPDEIHDGAAGTDDGLRYRMMYIPPELIRDACDRPSVTLPFVSTPVLSDNRLASALAEALADLDHAPDGLALSDLLARIADGLGRHAGNRQTVSRKAERAVARACAYLRENCAGQVSSEDLETLTNLNRYSLARQFRLVTGTSPHRYLTMRRLERARGTMRDGMPIAEAAYDAGFADQSHFTRHFRNCYGMTPGHWLTLLRA
ncbi:AraC family transcriptional regulator [Rhizobium cremeum]|uniref:AraC family transcriptional regulator n=1 Tax=Rhizobium cremeum TaxID=2813827 RepID=UPI000DDDD8DB